MKKLLFSIIAIIGFLSSCSNDDITIERTITFKVNPATVVDNLYEYKAGDLTSLSSDSKLHVTLLIYNEEGDLVDKVSNDYSAYTYMMNADIPLSAGNYTAVALSYVSSSVEYWIFSGLEKLSTFKISDANRIGGKFKILGLTIKSITVGENSETFNIDIENAGAVAFVRFKNWNKYTNIKSYALLGKQACDYLSFDNLGNSDYSLRSESSYNFYKFKIDYDSNYSGGIGYFFTFPIKNASFRFYAITTDDEYIPMGQEFVDDVNMGESYYFLYDFDEDMGYWYDKTPTKARSGKQTYNVDMQNEVNSTHIVYDYEGKSITIQ